MQVRVLPRHFLFFKERNVDTEDLVDIIKWAVGLLVLSVIVWGIKIIWEQMGIL
jgi:hypothetical protein